ncbi:MAG: 50S ribosomal protein L10 [Candidatus Doudnabacteria bacterium]|nr:50S ribosomal protein L10 [Candidatus Doudnabacteria bacterium]
MAVSRKEKEATLASLMDVLKKARGVVFTEYRGMTVKQLDNVRKNLRKENVKYQVVKVTLLKKAMEALGISTEGFKYNGPLALAVSMEEETAPARILKGMTKENPQLILDGGIFNQALVDASVVSRLASLPTKQQLLGQLVSVIAGPARGLVTVLSGNTRNLLNVLNAIKDKK